MILEPPSPLSQTVTLPRTPSHLGRDVLYGRPLNRLLCEQTTVGLNALIMFIGLYIHNYT